jgi:S1-C subfamily serine protease
VPSQAFLEQFRKSHLMAAVAQGQTFQFNLTSTGPLLPAISNCVVKIKAGGLSNAGDFSVSPAAAAKPQQTAAGQPSAPTPATGKQAAKPPKTVDVSGTGFAVSSNGYVVTNYHVIDGCVGDISGSLTRQSTLPLRVVSTDETNDLALLQAPPGRFRRPAAIRATTIHPGDAVIAIGFPYHGLLTSDFTVTTGTVSSLSGILNDTRYLQISAPVQPGNSGGPLLDTSGAVVGVVAAKLDALKFAKLSGGDLPENINFAIKTGAVRDFLDNGVVPYSTAESGPELKAADIADNARAFTMLISCTAAQKE